MKSTLYSYIIIAKSRERVIGAFGKRLTDVQQNNLKMGQLLFLKNQHLTERRRIWYRIVTKNATMGKKVSEERTKRVAGRCEAMRPEIYLAPERLSQKGGGRQSPSRRGRVPAVKKGGIERCRLSGAAKSCQKEWYRGSICRLSSLL
mgnify:CR=1 FL=1